MEVNRLSVGGDAAMLQDFLWLFVTKMPLEISISISKQ